MEPKKAVLTIGLIPELVDFTPFPGLNAEKVRAGMTAQTAKLGELGFDAHHLYVDLGETAESVVRDKLAERAFACVVIGAGVRVPPPHLRLFEKVLNIVHAQAPHAKLCFNTGPTDTVDAVQRWT